MGSLILSFKGTAWKLIVTYHIPLARSWSHGHTAASKEVWEMWSLVGLHVSLEGGSGG